jgi:hypothetical protein
MIKTPDIWFPVGLLTNIAIIRLPVYFALQVAGPSRVTSERWKMRGAACRGRMGCNLLPEP